MFKQWKIRIFALVRTDLEHLTKNDLYMSKEITQLKPTAVWKYFYDLTQIPRPTRHARKAAEYVKSVGEKLGLETHMDEVGNVVIRKPASKGLEDRPMVTLQGHCDMVPQKNNDVDHDFVNDPIDARIDGDFVRANNTTLGADNGIGVAMALAVLEDDTLKHGPLEVLVTIDEEEGMVGANALKPGFLKGDYLLNLDSEMDGLLYIGCAGGVDINVALEYKDETKVPEGGIPLEITLKGLRGGHSGGDIHLGRGNANKLMFRFLKKAVAAFDLELALMEGGSLRNAIPREATAVVVLAEDELEDFKNFVKEFEDLYNDEYKGIENHITLSCEQAKQAPQTVVPFEVRDNIINAIEACQNGAISFIAEFPDTVETSSNMASIRLGGGKFEVHFLTRSTSESRKEMLRSAIESTFLLIGASVEFDGDYNGWEPAPHSHVVEVMEEVFRESYGKEPQVMIMHAGLECGIIQGVMPNMEMISFGPTILHPHSPDEKVEIKTVENSYNFLLKSLERI